jgi:hypothetical protein
MIAEAALIKLLMITVSNVASLIIKREPLPEPSG